jgi:hypothetical protein
MFTPEEDALLMSVVGTTQFMGWDSVALHFQG